MENRHATVDNFITLRFGCNHIWERYQQNELRYITLVQERKKCDFNAAYAEHDQKQMYGRFVLCRMSQKLFFQRHTRTN